MSDQDDIFEDDKQKQTPPVETPPTTQSDPFSDLLAEVKNENGEPKYKSVEDAIKALNASQQFIETLKSEKADVANQLETAKQEIAKMGAVEDFVNRIAPNQAPKVDDPKPTGDEKQNLSEEKISELLMTTLQKREAEQRANDNLKTVVGELKQLHGDNAAQVIASRAKELGTTAEALRNLAKENPNMVLELFRVKNKSPVQSSQSTTSIPRNPNTTTETPVFEKSAARGGLSNKELRERWNKVKDYTYEQLNVET